MLSVLDPAVRDGFIAAVALFTARNAPVPVVKYFLAHTGLASEDLPALATNAHATSTAARVSLAHYMIVIFKSRPDTFKTSLSSLI